MIAVLIILLLVLLISQSPNAQVVIQGVTQFGSSNFTGTTTFQGPALFPNGTSSAPSITGSNAAYGMYFPNTGTTIAFTNNNTGSFQINGGGISLPSSATLSFLVGIIGTAADLSINRRQAGALTIDNNSTIGSMIKVDALPTVASGFGTGPTITNGSTPYSGSINVGTVTPGTGGVINFNGTAFPAAPFCLCNDDTSLLLVRCTETTTQLTITATALTASDVVTWICPASK
jgi:hypothetical protein